MSMYQRSPSHDSLGSQSGYAGGGVTRRPGSSAGPGTSTTTGTGSSPSSPSSRPAPTINLGSPRRASLGPDQYSPRRASFDPSALPAGLAGGNQTPPRRGSVPRHVYDGDSNWGSPTSGNRHQRRGSVVDLAADLMGPAGQENLAKVRTVSSKVEDRLDNLARPLRPYLPGIGRFLIVVTFLEDALRIMTQIGDQNYYLQKHRGFPWGLSHLFLYSNVIIMTVCSFLIIGKRYPEVATGGLFLVVLAQGFGYGLIFDLNFFLRNLSVIGGLLMVLSDSLSVRKSMFGSLPSLDINDADRKKYFQLAGRVLLIFLFLGFVFNGQFTFARAFVSLTGLVACIMVAVGFKAKMSALFLVTVLSVFNVFINNWWSLHSAHPQRDFLKYDFFQTLSIVGGLLLLVNMGAGALAMDSKKRL